jgi:DNA-binding response OmpR family regulator
MPLERHPISSAGRPSLDHLLSRTILVVDDDEKILELLRQILVREGYSVITAQDGHKAFRICMDCETAPDVLLTDVLLPGINGIDLMVLFEGRWPRIKTILFSGHTDGTPGLPEGKARTPFLTKPFSRDALLLTLREVLDDSSHAPAPAAVTPTILVVEDEPSVAKLLREFFRSLGFQVRFAATGSEGLALIEKAPPSLLVLDIYLPHMDGVEVLRRLRARWSEKLPFGVIILTGSRDEPLLQEALSLGAFDVLLKPVSIKQLELAVRIQLLFQETDPPRR